MSELPQREESWPSSQTAAGTPVAGLALWTLGQAALLAAIWGDLRLSANPAHTAGQLGIPLLLAGQIILSTALLADIARTVRLAAVAFAISFPVTQLAGWKCAAGAGTSLLCSAALGVWLAGLLGWMLVARGERARLLIAAGLMLWVAGTPLCWYVLREFAPATGLGRIIAGVSPVMLVGDMTRLMIVAAVHAAVAGVASYWRGRPTLPSRQHLA